MFKKLKNRFNLLLLFLICFIFTPLEIYATTSPGTSSTYTIPGSGGDGFVYGYGSGLYLRINSHELFGGNGDFAIGENPFISVNGSFQQLTQMNNSYSRPTYYGVSRKFNPVNGIQVSETLTPYDNRYLKQEITLTNTNSVPTNAGFKYVLRTWLHSDTTSTPNSFKLLSNGTGFKIYTVVKQATTTSVGRAEVATFLFQDTDEVTDVDGFGATVNNLNNRVNMNIPAMNYTPGQEYSWSGYGDVMYKWNEKNLAPGETRTYSILVRLDEIESGMKVYDYGRESQPQINIYNSSYLGVSNPGSSINVSGTMLSPYSDWTSTPIQIKYNIDGGATTDGTLSYVPTNTTQTQYPFSENIAMPSTPGRHTINIWAEGYKDETSDVKTLTFDINDYTPPTISFSQSPTGWTSGNVTITANAYDGVGVASIQTPDGNWINASSVNYAVGSNGTYYFTAKDVFGNVSTQSINISNIERTGPTATSVNIQNQDENGYDVYIYGVGDSTSGVNRVQFPTWTDYNGQDDLASTWWVNSSVSGTNLGGGTWKYHVAKADHNNELGNYTTHIYVYDNAGNYTALGTSRTLLWNDDATIVSDDIPTSMEAGTPYTIHVTVKNTGGKAWDYNFRLGAIGENDPVATTRQYLPTGITVAPGQSYTFTFTMTAPKSPGTYITDWQMVHEGVKWFGNTVSRNISVADTTPSTLTFSPSSFDPSNQGWTNKPQTIVVTASDIGSGVKQIKLPDGNYVSGSTASYIVSSNGTYNFSVTDNTGNVMSQNVVVSNIDMTVPSITITENTNLITNQNITLNVTTNDNLSGIKSITLPDGTIVNSSTTTYNVISNGNYSFTVEDYAGNKVTSTFTVSNIVNINNLSGIDHIEYKLDGATIQDWTTYPGSLTVTNEGITSISVRAIDKAGNVSDIATTFVKIDRSKPINSSIQIIIK